MASSLHVLKAPRSIFDSVGFKTEHFRGIWSPKKVAVDDNTNGFPEKVDEEDEVGDIRTDREVDLEFLSLIMKLWLRSIHRSEQVRQNELQDFENAIYRSQEEVVKPYQALLKSKIPSDLKEYWYERLEEACQKMLRAKSKAKFEMQEEERGRLEKESVFVCSLLGLKLDFLDSLDEMAPIHRNHRTLSNWIVRFLQNNSEFVALTDKTSLTKALLDFIGFDPLSSAVETILDRHSFTDSMKHHIEACEWADIFIEDEFKYNPMLSPSAVEFPFETNSQDTWFKFPNKGYVQDDHCFAVNIKNVVTKKSLDSAMTQSILGERVPPPESGQAVVLYHSTDHHSAADILNRGIDLRCGRQKRDFSSGSGFYLTKSLDDALNWAKSTTAKPAILVFELSREEYLKAVKLNLENDLEKWREIVSSFRSGRRTARTRQSLKTYDLIEGPMATVRRSQTTDELTLEPIPQSYQLCLNSEDFADEFQRNLHSILFFDKC